MNVTLAKKLARNITNEQLAQMFKSAKEGISDWMKRSAVNSGMSKGAVWNILAVNFDIEKDYHLIAKRNMIWEFGDFLPKELLPMKVKNARLPEIHHEEPIFEGE